MQQGDGLAGLNGDDEDGIGVVAFHLCGDGSVVAARVEWAWLHAAAHRPCEVGLGKDVCQTLAVGVLHVDHIHLFYADVGSDHIVGQNFALQ